MLTFILMTTFLPELMGGSTPLLAMLNPIRVLIYLISYGFAIVVYREVSVLLKLNYVGIFILSSSYGIINEGFIAKTMFKSNDLPVNLFDNYGYIGGISIPWTAYICYWHGYLSVLSMMIINDRLFPEAKGRLWFHPVVTFAIAILTSAFTMAFFLNVPSENKGNLQQAANLLGYIGLSLPGLFFRRWNDSETPRDKVIPPQTGWMALVGFLSNISYTVTLGLVAATKVNLLIYAAAQITIIFATGLLLYALSWTEPGPLSIYFIGFYLPHITFAFVTGIGNLPQMGLMITFAVSAIVAIKYFIKQDQASRHIRSDASTIHVGAEPILQPFATSA